MEDRDVQIKFVNEAEKQIREVESQIRKVEKQTIAGQLHRLQVAWKAFMRAHKNVFTPIITDIDWWIILIILDVIMIFASVALVDVAIREHELISVICGLTNAATCIINLRNLWYMHKHG